MHRGHAEVSALYTLEKGAEFSGNHMEKAYKGLTLAFLVPIDVFLLKTEMITAMAAAAAPAASRWRHQPEAAASSVRHHLHADMGLARASIGSAGVQPRVSADPPSIDAESSHSSWALTNHEHNITMLAQSTVQEPAMPKLTSEAGATRGAAAWLQAASARLEAKEKVDDALAARQRAQLGLEVLPDGATVQSSQAAGGEPMGWRMMLKAIGAQTHPAPLGSLGEPGEANPWRTASAH